MATINSTYKRRMDDIVYVSQDGTQKRKVSNSAFFTRHAYDSHLLIPSEKRKRTASEEFFSLPYGKKAELFPSSVHPMLRHYDYAHPSFLGIFSPRPQSSPQALPATATPARNDVPALPATSQVVRNLGNAPKESLLARRDSGKLSVFTKSFQASASNGHIGPRDYGMEALPPNSKRSNQEKLELMEALERSHADNLKLAADLQGYKYFLHYKELVDKFENVDLAQGSRTVNGQTEGFGFLPRKDFLGISNSSVSRDVLVSDSMAPSGSLADEGTAVSGGSGAERTVWKELLSKIRDPVNIEKKASLDKEIEFTAAKLRALQLERTSKLKAEKKPEDKTLVDAFTPLSAEAEEAVDEALGGADRSEILVTHEISNIDVSRGKIQCLSPGAWLNDEVINVYMDLLKGRELRESDRFLKCHFFNTFFYNKLFKDKRSYDYKAVRRWTTQKKLGYSLSACDKVLVPIHQDNHWCLAVINIRDQKLEYLDSLLGVDRSVLDVLARYITDEEKDKNGKVLDSSTWEKDYPKDIPEQLNGCDCGMFMVKYADFHSRGAPLQFSQEDMNYFRRKMVYEILTLTAT